jgi:hypothetical protein
MLGISLGIAGACVIVLLGYMYRRHLEETDRLPTGQPLKIDSATSGDQETDAAVAAVMYKSSKPDGMAEPSDIVSSALTVSSAITLDISSVPNSDVESAVRLDAVKEPTMEQDPPKKQLVLSEMSSSTEASYGHFLASNLPQSALFSSGIASDMFPEESQNVHLIHNASFSSSDGGSYDGILHADSFNDGISAFDGSRDELENYYKNQNLEIFRQAVEEMVDDVDGMIFIAVTKALTEPALSPGNGQDDSSLEAEYLYQTYDWWKRNEKSVVDSR